MSDKPKKPDWAKGLPAFCEYLRVNDCPFEPTAEQLALLERYLKNPTPVIIVRPRTGRVPQWMLDMYADLRTKLKETP